MRVLMLLLLILLPLASSAAQRGRQPLAISAITEQQAEIRAGVEAGTGRYKDMPPAKRGELLAKQQTLLAMLNGKRSTEDLTEVQRNDAFNALEWIEATINNAEDDRMVCSFERTIGSNRKTRVCKTVAQIRREHEEARRRVDNGMDLNGTR